MPLPTLRSGSSLETKSNSLVASPRRPQDPKTLSHQHSELLQDIIVGKDDSAKRILEFTIEMKDKQADYIRDMLLAWKNDVVAICERRFAGELEVARKREEDGILANGKLREELDNEKGEIGKLRERIQNMERQKVVNEEWQKREMERLEHVTSIKDGVLQGLRQDMTGKIREITNLENKIESIKREKCDLVAIAERMGQERAELVEQVRCKEQEKEDMKIAMALQEVEVKKMQQELTSKIASSKELKKDISELRIEIRELIGTTKASTARSKEEERKSWRKNPITGSLFKYIGNWYAAGK